ncbi:MAG: tRNA (adenosine(37)-N6)-threonylcarbamoyltransferase complex transferase subunit TsaD [Anaerolineae bacterium]|nr:tRNA (adenosine(37)-N6)-threonylcarbamoyltransferase complex transferase subunit TsaD [Anaerolineae bacterium]
MALILGVETSCDETAAAVVQDGRRILSNVVASQIALHEPYGGVFPEVASRQHVLAVVPVIRQALRDAGADWPDLAAVAVTHGPGLAGSLLVGLNSAKAVAWMRGLPLVGINHLEGHVYSNWLDPRRPGNEATVNTRDSMPPQFPALVLIVSGGHTELVLMREHCSYERLGGTLDDAAGEAFDKVARLLGLGYPGGPATQRAAEGGDPAAFPLPRAWLPGTYDFSFSGLKTAALRLVERDSKEAKVKDLAASFQMAVADVLVEKTRQAAEATGARHVCVCGGVAANKVLRQEMQTRLAVPVSVPPLFLCTDNAAMVACAGHYRYVRGERAGWDLDVVANLKLV